MRKPGECTCGSDPDEPHDCGREYIPPYPGPSIEIVPGVDSCVCLNCGGWLVMMPL